MTVYFHPKKPEVMVIDFEEAADHVDSVDEAHDIQQKEKTDMKHFLKSIDKLNLPEVKNHPEIDKYKKRIEAFAKQYGEKTQKTTSIFMNYLEKVRETGVSHLRSHEHLKASSYFAECLRFIDPKYDEVFYQKFLIVKIDAINKLMYCLCEIESKNKEMKEQKRIELKESSRYINALKIMSSFLNEVYEFPKIESLKKSENCQLEVSYFYFGRLYRKNTNCTKAIEAFQTALELISVKMTTKYTSKHEQIRTFLQNIRAKTYYKISKCYREQKQLQKQNQYQTISLKEAKSINNHKLYIYLHKKIQSYDRKKKFKERLTKLEGKKRIDEEIYRLVEQSKQFEIDSLYDIYNHQVEPRR